MTQILIESGNAGAVTTGATSFLSLGSGPWNASGAETNYQTTWRTGGIFSNLYCRITANATTGSSTVRYRVAAASGNQVVTIGSAATGEFTDSSNTDTASAGNKIDYQVVNGGGGSITIAAITERFAPTTASNTVNKLTCTGSISDVTALATYYQTLGGALGIATNNTTEVNAQFKNKVAATLTNLFVFISANTASIATVTSRVNAGAGNLTVSIGSGTTGAFEDTTHTDTLAAGNLVNTALNSTVTTTLTCRIIAVDYTTTIGQTAYMAADASAASTIGIGLARYFFLAGSTTGQATESVAQALAQIPFTASNLEAYVVTNSITTSSSVKLRQNANSSNNGLSIANSTTGYYEDTTHTDLVGASDEIDYSVVVGATGTSLAFGSIGILANYNAIYQDPLWFGMPF